MNISLKEFVNKHIGKDFDALPDSQKAILRSLFERLHLHRKIHQKLDGQETFGERVADKVASFGGSWTFIIIFGSVLVFWVILNSLILAQIGGTFDPYPYILLNLFLSMLASIQAPIIMMSQNRQSAKDREAAVHDYEVNMKAEFEILSLHEKLDDLRDNQWTELVRMQQEQIALLTEIIRNYEKK